MEQSAQEKQRYQEMVKEVSRNSALAGNCLRAFISGGLVCVVGQFLTNRFTTMGASATDAGMYTAVTLIFIGILMTGLGIYDKIGKHAGAGFIVPITGFANAIAAPAIEFKREGYVLGVGAKMFIVAGPVIVYGVLSSVFVGLLYFFMR